VTRPQTILVVEDHDDLRHIFSAALSLAGFEVKQASDGLAALHYLEFETPDLVVLDLFMPRVSGFVVHQDLASRSDLRHIPIVIVTAATIRQTAHLDVACLLYKPVFPDELVEAVTTCLKSGSALRRH
jgi:DNA-binding response OmpR family regulator